MLLEVNVDVHSEDLNTSNPIIQSYTLMGNFLTVHSLDHHHIISHDHTHTYTHSWCGNSFEMYEYFFYSNRKKGQAEV